MEHTTTHAFYSYRKAALDHRKRNLPHLPRGTVNVTKLREGSIDKHLVVPNLGCQFWQRKTNTIVHLTAVVGLM